MVQLPIVFIAIVVTFVAATAFSQWRLAALDRASLDIAENAAPSIERLASARGEMRRLQGLVREYVESKAAGEPVDVRRVEESRRSLDRSIEEYLALPVFPGEHELWADILRSKDTLNRAVTSCIGDADRGDLTMATAVFRNELSNSVDDLGSAITRDVEFNAAHSRDLAVQIERLRGRATYLAFVLDAACVLLTISGAIELRRGIRAHAALSDQHQRLLEERASELEQFAGTVAHDILSPLGAVGLSLQLAASKDDEQSRARLASRGMAALDRVKSLVHGLLEFARAGAKPDSSARTDVARTIADLVEHLGAEATKAGVELVARADVTGDVCCNAGVLMSLVGNLGRNALKYIGDGPDRRVEIRALDRAELVRVEVHDNGPGLPPGLEAHVFEPYVRGARATQPGIGLGLATVKRLAVAHRGTCGVDSVVGEGCTFWFELPKAGPADRSAAPIENATAA
jgi:signal transduction histidine kinase